MKKINIGILLTILAIIVFTIFMIIDSKNKEMEVEKAKKFATEYLKASDKYMLMPEGYRDIEKQMDEDEYNKYLLEVRNEMSKYILDTALDFNYNYRKTALDEQYRGKLMYKEYETEIISYNYDKFSDVKTEMKGDCVILIYNFNRKITADRRESPTFDPNTNRYVGTIKSVEGIESYQDYIVVKKVENGEYKVLYHIVPNPYVFTFE